MDALLSSRVDLWSARQHDLGQYGAPVAAALLSILALQWLCSAVYQAYFSPLAHIPGPKLAAMTYLYEGYYEVWLGGKYFLRIAEMHKQYGPIVRITPNEVHFSDPKFLDTLYPVGGRKTDKPAWFSLITGTPYSIVSTTHHDLHRQRRNALSSFFSTASVHRLENIMKEHCRALVSRLDDAARHGSILRIHEVFKAVTSDVITQYAFEKSFHFLQMEDYGRSYFDATNNFFFLTHICVLLPWVYPLIQGAPDWLLGLLFPGLIQVRGRQKWWLEQVHTIRNSPDPERVNQSIFGGILNSKLPSEEKTDLRLASEAQLVVFAGEGTTAWGLNAALFELLAHPEELRKVQAELATVDVDGDGVPPLAQVESLPYLSAVIQEALRRHPGVLTRQMRVSPEVPVTYTDRECGKTYVVPPGVTTSMSPHITHQDAEAFEDPAAFRPQRWIDDPKLGRYFHGFARGSRNCVGMTLARREMAIVLSTLLLRYELYDKQQKGFTMELFNTTRERDVEARSDYIIPLVEKGSDGVQIKFRA